jgi:cyclic beta-1,2-glucan synthetase
MSRNRKKLEIRKFVKGAWIKKYSMILSLMFFSMLFSFSSESFADSPDFKFVNIKQKGVFNIGDSKGHLTRSADKEIQKDVLSFKYLIPSETAIGVWTKNFPSKINKDSVQTIKVGVNVFDKAQAEQIAVNVEVKGIRGIQNISVKLCSGWSFNEKTINWNAIGDLTEIVFVVKSNTIETIEGTVNFDVEFGQLTFFQKNFALKKIGLVFLFSFLMALIFMFILKLFGKKNIKDKTEKHVKDVSILKRIRCDLFYGIFSVILAGTVLFLYYLGIINSVDSGLGFLVVGFIGALIADILKYKFTGKHLTFFQIFQNILLTGILAASASSQGLLHAPADLNQLLLKCNITACVAFLIYHIFNAYTLASEGKHIRFTSGLLIVGTPFAFGWLLLLENAGILQIFGNSLTGGILTTYPAVLDFIGRFLVVFGFNQLVMNGISLAVKGKFVKKKKSHLIAMFISLGVVASPLIADLGSTAFIAGLPSVLKAIAAIITAILSQAGLWTEVYFITGMILDSAHKIAPSDKSISSHSVLGLKKGVMYSGVFMTIVYMLSMFFNAPMSQSMMTLFPTIVGILFGALVFPLIKTIIETFDGSQAFFGRMRYSYRNVVLYARGAVIGFGFAYGISSDIFLKDMSDRVLFGLIVGLAASVGISLVRDIVNSIKNQGRIQTWKVYFIDAILGGFIGSAAAFYLDSSQVPVILEKFKLYNSSGLEAKPYTIYPLISKWGRIDLGSFSGGVKLFFNEALAGVINWSVAAWLFAVNRVFMQAFFQKDKAPIKFFFSKAGLVELVNHMIYVLRWGLWMSPIIHTFLRMMSKPTWYNQDGAIRTLVAIYHNITMSTGDFQNWSLNVFICVLAYNFFRVLIWVDHMGLRVATLVNLSFIGMDKLDDRIARFIGKSSTQRCIPEAVKRFTTWAPLLLPFYIPRGQAWDYAWAKAEAMQNAATQGGLINLLKALSFSGMLFFIVSSIIAGTVISFVVRLIAGRSKRKRLNVFELTNRDYKVVISEDGGGYSEMIHTGYDIGRRSYDTIEPCGRALHVVDTKQSVDSENRSWPILGNFPKDKFQASCIRRQEDSLVVVNESNDIKTTVKITLPEDNTTAEIWSVTVDNLTDKARNLKIIPYLEWVLSKADDDRFHPQYARLFPEMQYVNSANSILTWQKNTKTMGILASDVPAEGFLRSRMDFIGRAHSLWSPRIAQTLDFLEAVDTPACPTFDPIGSLMVNVDVEAKGSKTVKFMVGCAKDKEKASELIHEYLKPEIQEKKIKKTKAKTPLIGHGEILPGTPQPYYKYSEDGNKLIVKTPYTTRPYDHAMSNAAGHFVVVTNRGLHTTSNGNSQQNRITPDCPDTVTREIPGEAFYLYDIDGNEWYSPTHHPLNDYSAKNESEFGVDGTAIFRMTKGTVSTELTVFVPTDETVGVYLLKIKNNSKKVKRMRIAPYFQIVLAGQPEWSGQLKVSRDKKLDALFFENPRNSFRRGPAFVSMSIPSEHVETKRGKFFGKDCNVNNPFMVKTGKSDNSQLSDTRPVAGIYGTVEIPANGEYTVSVVLGQADNKKIASAMIKKYKDIKAVENSLENTKKWWLALVETSKIETNNKDFDNMQNWLKYQAVAERIWARRGFYQSSGAYGFRDQLQDTVNLIWVDPALARKQILLHASHQFIEGDVVHWFHTLHDGKTAFSNRSHASDNLLWLVWGVVEYISATGDKTILDEMTSYLVSEIPFQPLPKNKHGWGTIYHRSAREDSVYKHCLKSINLVFEKRIGKNGLPLIGTGDWNDGLDEIGSKGKGESVWLGFFLYYIMKRLINIIEEKDGVASKEKYSNKMQELESAIEATWRGDRYLRAFHDDGTEIGVKDSGIWEIDALTAAWAVKAGINPERELIVFNTALKVLERDNVILLGWPALREDSKPFLGRSSKYPEGVRENGMYCHGVQWLVKAARVLAERFEQQGDKNKAKEYRAIAYRLWMKITPISHVTKDQIEIYGGQPNKQAADLLTTYDQGRMIWNGYTGAAGWLVRQAFEGVVGAKLVNNELVLPDDLKEARGTLKIKSVKRDLKKSPL